VIVASVADKRLLVGDSCLDGVPLTGPVPHCGFLNSPRRLTHPEMLTMVRASRAPSGVDDSQSMGDNQL
jgi:hypothetical protein